MWEKAHSDEFMCLVPEEICEWQKCDNYYIPWFPHQYTHKAPFLRPWVPHLGTLDWLQEFLMVGRAFVGRMGI